MQTVLPQRAAAGEANPVLQAMIQTNACHITAASDSVVQCFKLLSFTAVCSLMQAHAALPSAQWPSQRRRRRPRELSR